MKILHTSDWHLGQSFKGRSREFEHKAFLKWLLEEIHSRSIETLIVAGDIFDTSNPPNYALKMYHDFLAHILKTDCKDIVIIAGNHDGISTLEVSKDLLKSLNIHVVASGEDKDETLVKIQRDGELKAIICAVPYLRDRVLRNANESKTSSEVEDELRDAIKQYYKDIYNRAKDISTTVPIIATGHFTTTGASISPDSERDIYIGKLQNIDSEVLSRFDYVAMGHIHKPQQISKNEMMQYSGSAIPLSFSEAKNQKSVVIIDFKKKKATLFISKIPLFKKLHRVSGSFEEIKKEIQSISDISNPPFVEVLLKGNDILNYDINDFIYKSNQNGVDILILKKENQIEDRVLDEEDENITLKELDPVDIFDKRLTSAENLNIDDKMKEKLKELHVEVLKETIDEDY